MTKTLENLPTERFKITSIVSDYYKNKVNLIDNCMNMGYLIDKKSKLIILIDIGDSFSSPKYYITKFMNNTLTNISDKHKEIISTKLDNEINYEMNTKNRAVEYILPGTKIAILKISLDTYVGCNNPNLQIINEILEKLNIKLKKKCDNLKLVISQVYNLENPCYNNEHDKSWWKDDSLVICLYLNDRCISSIILKPWYDPDTLELTSETDTTHVNKKYNSLLRSVMILICIKLFCSTNIKKLVSLAINPISVYSLITKFDTITDIPHGKDQNIQEYLKEQQKLNPNTSALDIIKEYMRQKEDDDEEHLYEDMDFGIEPMYEAIKITIELTAENILTANNLFNKLVSHSKKDSITCDIANLPCKGQHCTILGGKSHKGKSHKRKFHKRKSHKRKSHKRKSHKRKFHKRKSHKRKSHYD